MSERAVSDDASWSSGRPSPDVRDAVRTACRLLHAVEDDFVRRVRASLPSLVPELRYTTADDGAAIAEGLARAVLWSGLTGDPPDVVESTLRNVGLEYARQGFPAGGYHGAGHALLRAARGTQFGDWSSELSSAWVAYYGWLSTHLAAGVTNPGPPPSSSPSQASKPLPARAVPAAPALRTGPDTLDDVLELLHVRYFAGNERALGAILTRVALRTGADLRAPRPDQRADPAVVANVVAVLQVMGYVLPPSGDPAPTAVPPGHPGRQVRPSFRPPRWWSRSRAALWGAR
jgi:hemoglobin-like flavoprotein